MKLEKKSHPTHISKSLQHVLPKIPHWHLTIIMNWESIIGNLKTKVHLINITKTTIKIGVNDSSWLQELYLLSHEVIHTINSFLDTPYIQKIQFILKISAKKKQKKIVNSNNAMHLCSILTKKQVNALQDIHDPGLKNALCAFLHRCSKEG